MGGYRRVCKSDVGFAITFEAPGELFDGQKANVFLKSKLHTVSLTIDLTRFSTQKYQ
jgi:hypothetical protein